MVLAAELENIFDPNLDFYENFDFFYENIDFFMKIWIFYENLDFYENF